MGTPGSEYGKIDLEALKNTSQYSTLFVCTANQCRSPMAEVLFIQYLQTKGFDPETWLVASAGCWAYPDQPATENAVKTVDSLGCNLHLHSSQAVSENLLRKFNLVLCMEVDHKIFITRNFPDMAEKIFLFSEMIGKEVDIDDPVSGSLVTYADTANEIKSIMTSGFNKILKLSKY